MGVNPKIGGNTPKWMVKIRENPIKMDDLRGPLNSNLGGGNSNIFYFHPYLG